MKKKFLITSLLAGTFLLSACGNKKPEFPEGELGSISMNEETEETKETEIKSAWKSLVNTEFVSEEFRRF